MESQEENIVMTRYMRGDLNQPTEGVNIPMQENRYDFVESSRMIKKSRRKQIKPEPYPLWKPYTRVVNKFRLNSKAQFDTSLKKNQVIDQESTVSESGNKSRRQRIKSEIPVSIQVKNNSVDDKGKQEDCREENYENESCSSLEKEKHVAWVLVELENTINIIPCSHEP